METGRACATVGLDWTEARGWGFRGGWSCEKGGRW